MIDNTTLEALKTLKKECEETDSCKRCFLRQFCDDYFPHGGPAVWKIPIDENPM